MAVCLAGRWVAVQEKLTLPTAASRTYWQNPLWQNPLWRSPNQFRRQNSHIGQGEFRRRAIFNLMIRVAEPARRADETEGVQLKGILQGVAQEACNPQKV